MTKLDSPCLADSRNTINDSLNITSWKSERLDCCHCRAASLQMWQRRVWCPEFRCVLFIFRHVNCTTQIYFYSYLTSWNIWITLTITNITHYADCRYLNTGLCQSYTVVRNFHDVQTELWLQMPVKITHLFIYNTIFTNKDSQDYVQLKYAHNVVQCIITTTHQ